MTWILLLIQIIGICQSEVKIVSITPSSNSILTYEPIQIVFSKGIIKFGTDLSSPAIQLQGYPIILESSGHTSPLEFGSWRWITTSILRFDANNERWPGDLTITATVNTTFTSYKGDTITLGSNPPPSWNTQSLNLYIGNVFSPLATAATEGAWQSNLGYLGYFNKYEIPPDSIITVYTNAPVDTTLISRPGFIYCDGISVRYSNPPVAVPHPCAITGHNNHTTCFNITLSTPLSPTKECNLALSRTMRYDTHSGHWSGQVSIILSGIIPFKFVFYTTSQRGYMSSKRLSLPIQHGLRTGTNLTSIITITPSVPKYSAIVRNSSRVVLNGQFNPGTEYTVKVTPPPRYNFVDNLGMPLEGSYGSFNMADEKDDVYYPNNGYDVTQFPLQDSYDGYPMVTRNDTRWNVKACSVTITNLGQVLQTVFGPRWGSSSTICNREDDTAHTLQRGVTHLVNNTEMNESPNISIISITDNTSRYQWYHRPRIIIRSDIQVLLSPVYMSGSGMINADIGVYNIRGIHVQLTSPLVATIQLWGTGGQQDHDKPIYFGNTNKMGYIFIPYCNTTCLQQGDIVIIVVLIDDNIVYIHPSRVYIDKAMYESNYVLEQKLYTTLVTDRAIYAPNEIITMSGWIVSSSSACLACQPINITQYIFTAVLTWSPSLPTTEVAISVDDNGIVYPLNITVPKSTPLGSKPSVSIACTVNDKLSSIFQPDCGMLGVDSPDILIAEPRVPIAIMELIVPSLITTHDNLTSNDVYITLKTYTGIPLPNTSVQVTIKVIQPYSDNVGCEMGQEVDGYNTYSDTYDTDENGIARVALFDTILAGPWQEGYTIEITGISRDPLGAVLTSIGSISINHPILSLNGLELSVTNPIPGIIFQATTHITLTDDSYSFNDISARAYAMPGTTCQDATRYNANKDLETVSKSNCSIAASNGSVECTMLLNITNSYYAIVIEVEDNIDNTSAAPPPVKVCKGIQSTPRITSYAIEGVKCRAYLNNNGLSMGYSTNEVELSCPNPYPNAEEDTFVWITWPGGHSGIITLDKGLDTFTRILTVYNLTLLGNSITFSAYFWQAINTQLPFSLSLPDDKESDILPSWGGSRYTSGSAVLDISPQLALPYNKYKDTFSVHPDREEYLPGDEVTLSINGGVPNGVVILTVVDKGVLDLKPLNTPNTIQNIIGMMGIASCRMMDSHYFISSSKTLSNNAYHLWSIVKDDPWINVDFDTYWIDNDYISYLNTSIFEQQLGPGNYKAEPIPFYGRCEYKEKDGLDEVYYSSPVESGGGISPTLLDMPAPSTSPEDGSSASNGQDTTISSSSSSPREVTNTPKLVYYSIINITSNGNATASFTLPQHRKRYAINAYMVGFDNNDDSIAAAAQLLANTESTITVTSPIYMEPYIPRALRITDEPLMGVAVIASNYTIDELMLMNPSVLIYDISEKAFSPIDDNRKDLIIIPGNAGVAYALFKLPVVAYTNTVNTTAWVRLLDGKDDIVDDIIIHIIIGPHSQPIVIGTSRAIPASPTTPGLWEDDITLPEIIPSASTLQLSVESSFYPRVVHHCNNSAFIPYIDGINNDDIKTDTLIATAYCLSISKVKDIPKAILGDYDNKDDIVRSILQQLIDIHTVNGVLKWSRNSPSYPSYTSIWLQSMAILVFNEYIEYSTTARQLWLKAAINAINDILDRYPYAKPYEDVARLYHATGATKLHALPHPYDDINTFINVLKGPMDHSLIAWLLVKVTTSDISIQDTQTILWNNIRISSGNTAYIAHPGLPSPLSDNQQALALRLAAMNVNGQEDIEVLWRVGVWLGQGGIEGKWGIYNRGLSTETLIFAIQAFNELDNSLTNDNLSLNVTVTNGVTGDGGDIIWSTQLNKNITSSYTSDISLPQKPFNTTIKWNVTGSGTALSFLTANILPRYPFQWPIDRGFAVRKFIQVYDPVSGECFGNMLTSIVTGQLICITITVNTHDDVKTFILEDMTPSGLEPLDDNIDSLNFDTSPTGSIEYSIRTFSSMPPCNTPWWLPCQRQTKRTGKDRVVWEVDGITASQEMTFKYFATANVPGHYTLPQTKCYDITNPMYMGMSGHSRFTVTLPGILSGLVLPIITEDMARRALLGDEGTDCVGKAPLENSWCDLSSGEWMCGMSACDDIQGVLQGECDYNDDDGEVSCMTYLNQSVSNGRWPFNVFWLWTIEMFSFLLVVSVN